MKRQNEIILLRLTIFYSSKRIRRQKSEIREANIEGIFALCFWKNAKGYHENFPRLPSLSGISKGVYYEHLVRNIRHCLGGTANSKNITL